MSYHDWCIAIEHSTNLPTRCTSSTIKGSEFTNYFETTLHGSKHERVREALLNEFIDFIMGQCPWLTSALKQMVSAPDGTHEVPAVILHLGGDVTMEKRSMASALLFGFLSSKKPKKRAYAPIFNPLLS